MDQLANNYYTQCFFDSKVRFYGTSSRPTFSLETQANEFNAYRLEKVAVSNTIYNINATNSLLTMDQAGDEYNVSLAQGNYDQTSFINALTTALNAGALLGVVYTVSISSLTGKLTITATGNFTIVSQGSLYSFDLDGIAKSSWTGTGFLDLQPYTTLYLCSSLKSSKNFPGGLIGNVINDYVIGSIYLNADVGYWHVQESISQDFIDANGRFNVPIEFWIVDAFGNQIDFNGGSFAVTMGFQIDRYL